MKPVDILFLTNVEYQDYRLVAEPVHPVPPHGDTLMRRRAVGNRQAWIGKRARKAEADV